MAWGVEWLWLCVWSETHKNVVTMYGAHQRRHPGSQMAEQGATGVGPGQSFETIVSSSTFGSKTKTTIFRFEISRRLEQLYSSFEGSNFSCMSYFDSNSKLLKLAFA